jgi:hypothetical protein
MNLNKRKPEEQPEESSDDETEMEDVVPVTPTPAPPPPAPKTKSTAKKRERERERERLRIEQERELAKIEAKKKKRRKMSMGMPGAVPTVQQVENLLLLPDPSTPEAEFTTADEEAMVIDTTENPAENPFAQEIDLPMMDEAMEQEFVFIERNKGDIVMHPTTETKLTFAEHVKGPPIYFENSQRIWGTWYNLILKTMNDEGKAQNEIKKKILRPNGVLATVSGENLGPRGKNILERTVGAILKASSPSISDIPHNNKWAMVECVYPEQKAKLLAAKIVFNAKDSVYVTFRKPTTAQNNYRALEIRGIGSQEHWEKVLKRFTKVEKVTVKSTIPEAYDKEYNERVIWWITFTDPKYAHPEKITIEDGENEKKTISVNDAISCAVCAAYGHHLSNCEYKKMKKVNMGATAKRPGHSGSNPSSFVQGSSKQKSYANVFK